MTPQPGAPVGAKPYVLLRDTLRQSGQAAVTKVTVGTREWLALLRPVGDMLMLKTMYWPDEIRSAEEVPHPGHEVAVHSNEVRKAISLMETMTRDWRAERDDYADALRELAEVKLECEPLPEVEEPDRTEAESVEELMAALRASIERESKEPPPRRPPRPAAKNRSKKPHRPA